MSLSITVATAPVRARRRARGISPHRAEAVRTICFVDRSSYFPYTRRMRTLLLSLAAATFIAASVTPAAALAAEPMTAVRVEHVAPALALRADALADALHAQAGSGAPHAVLESLAAIDDAVAFELVASRLIDRWREQGPQPGAHSVLEWLATQPVRVVRQHEESAADHFEPVFAIAARAIGTLDLWQRQQARDGWRQRLASSPFAAVEALRRADAMDRSLAATAVEMLDDAALDALHRQMPVDAPVALWHAVAMRRADVDAFLVVLAHGDAGLQLDVVARAPAALPASEAMQVLESARQQPGLASAALLAMASLAPEHAPALDTLLASLDDPASGASGAAALARMPTADRGEHLASWLDAQPDEKLRAPRTRHLVLAVQLEGSPQAVAALQRFGARDAVPGVLRKELQP
jgi:hypothetical protein